MSSVASVVCCPSTRPAFCIRNLILLALLLALTTLPALAVTYYSVNTLSDIATGSGTTGSLRYVLSQVNAGTGSGDEIFIDVVGTITLTNGPLVISKAVTIFGPDAALLTISGNNATRVFSIPTAITVSMYRLTIANGTDASGAGSGGIFTGSSLTLTEVAFSGNSAPLGGGAIDSFGALIVVDCTFVGNTGLRGAIYNGGTMSMQNSTLTRNTATDGGAINSASALTLQNSTVTGNTASTLGGGIYIASGSVTITNSIVAGNTTTGNAGGDCQGCGTQGTHNLISSTTPANIISASSLMLGPLQYNGSDTQTIMPLVGSPAILAGINSPTAYDQRNFSRMIGASAQTDLGAVSTHYLTVNSTAGGATGSTCTGGANCTLVDAVTVIKGMSDGDIIFSSAVTGTITLTVSLPHMLGNANLQGPGASILTVSGANLYSLVDFEGYGNLSGITLSNGLDTTGNGGGVVNNGILATLSNCVVMNNVEASAAGGGNSANQYMAGGGVDNEDNMLIDNCTISGNTVQGGVAHYATGGGIYSNGYLILSNSLVSGNTASDTAAGGVAKGGGIASDRMLVILNSTLSGNTATSSGPTTGGGLQEQGTAATLINTTITGNTVTDTSGGGALGAGIDSYYALNVLNSTITGNTTSSSVQTYGGGIYSFSNVTLLNSIVAGNTTAGNAGDDCDLCGTQDPSNIISTTAAPITAAQLMLAPLALYGSNQTVPTLLPLPGSPAIQAGNLTLLTPDITTDERGLPRTLTVASTNLMDVGAVQSNYSAVQFVQQPTDDSLGLPITPAVTLSVIESGAAVPNIPVPIAFAGTGTMSGTLSQTTLTPTGGGVAVATYNDLSVATAGTGDVLNVNLPITPTGATSPVTLSAHSSSFAILASPYSITASPSSLTIAAGSTGTTTLTFTPVAAYTGNVTLSCGSLPAFTKCAFTQGGTANATVKMVGNTTPITVTLTISTNVATSMNVLPSILQNSSNGPATLFAKAKTPTPMNPILPALAFWAPGGLAGLAAFSKRKKLTKKQFGFLQLGLLILLTGAIAAGVTGCGGSGSSGSSTPVSKTVTPAGTSAVVITATPTAGTANTLTLNVTITG